MAKTFEECLEEIDKEISKRRSRWTLTAVPSLDYDDVSQIIRIHIHKKWSQYDDAKPLSPWINSVISSQMKNIIRNVYSNYCRPCLKCAAALEPDGCEIYGDQCSSCPLFKNWERGKKKAYNTKLPLPIENHPHEINGKHCNYFDIERATEVFHETMLKKLAPKPTELKLYKLLYIEHKSEEEAAKALGYRTSEKNRSPGYRQIKNLKRQILDKAKKMLLDGDIDFI